MKKTLISLGLILLLFSLISCKQNSTENKLVTEVGESNKFTKEEINKAIKTVENNTSHAKTTLTKIWYDEEISNKYTKLYLENGKEKESGIKPDNTIVLLSNLNVDSSARPEETTMTSGKTYKNYQWVLIRDNKTSDWKIDDWGY